ncbi:MAG: Cas10/Cmr2 second palm domain-containing protein, partial [Thermoplasmata archaeon]
GVLKDQHGDSIGIDKYLDYLISYIQEISNKSSDDINKINNIKIKIKEMRKDLYGNENNNILSDGVPLTLSYAYTLSRSLTLQAILDKMILESYKAFPIYLGGDDILAFSPIKYKDELAVIKAVSETRKSYWTYHDDIYLKKDGFKSYKGLVSDSLRSYGRSYSIFIAHYKDPLPLSLSIANYLLDLKDNIKGKDVLFVSSGRGIENLDYALFKLSENTNLDLSQLLLIEKTLKLVEEKKISNSLIYDVFKLLDYKDEDIIYKNLILKTIKRNSNNEKDPSINDFINDLKEKIGTKVCETSYKDNNPEPCKNIEKDICKNKEFFSNIIMAVNYLR